MTTKDVLALSLEALKASEPSSCLHTLQSTYAEAKRKHAEAITAIKQAITAETGNAAIPLASAITAGNGKQAQEPETWVDDGGWEFPIEPAPKQAEPAVKESLTAQWQPIESAPKDGREIIIRNGDRVGAATWIKWPSSEHEDAGEGWTICHDSDTWDDEKAPTHWMPLPTPPEAA